MIETCADFFYAFLALVDLGPAFNVILETIKVIIPFFAALLGATLAYKNIEKKHEFDEEVLKIKEANKIFLLISSCLSALITRRQSYTVRLDDKDNCEARGLFIVAPFLQVEKVKADLSNLTFMAPFNQKTTTDDSGDYMDLMDLEDKLDHFNSLVSAWKSRDELWNSFQKKLSEKREDIDTIRNIYERVGEDLISLLIATEGLIAQTEEFIPHLEALLNSMPKIASKHINLKRLKNRYHLLTCHIKKRECVNSYSTSDLEKFIETQRQLN